MRFNAKTTAMILLFSLSGAGCAQKPSGPPNFLTFQRGQQLLAAGSPKSAIPLLTQTIASAPDGPEPMALLSLSYALDLQYERAILQAQRVKRAPHAAPGWEFIAIGIAELTQRHTKRAIDVLNCTCAGSPKGNAVDQAAMQWLAVAHLLNGDRPRAMAVLKRLSETAQMHTTTLLWMVLIDAQTGNEEGAKANLMECARAASTEAGRKGISADIETADDQTLYDVGVAMMAAGDLDKARHIFAVVQERNPLASDAGVWVALIDGALKDWQGCRNLLKDRAQVGGTDSRGLANQLFSIVCAMEDRPEDVVLSTLAGQRLLGRNSQPPYVIEPPKPEPVWNSDNLK